MAEVAKITPASGIDQVGEFGASDLFVVNRGGVTKAVSGVPTGIAGAYADRATFLAATIPAPVLQAAWVTPTGIIVAVARKVGGAIVQDDATEWTPVGAASPYHYGATGDGTTDDTTALQAMLTDGLSIRWDEAATHYRTANTLLVTVPGQVITGIGAKSKIVIDDMTGTSRNVIYVQADDVEISGMTIVPTIATINAITTGYAIKVDAQKRVKIHRNTITGHRQGIFLDGSTHCEVHSNFIYDSVVNSLVDISTNTGSDIRLGDGASWNSVKSNSVKTGAGVGVMVQANTEPTKCNHNVIDGNVLHDLPQYGICLYDNSANTLTFANEVRHNVISNNIISEVRGDIDNASAEQTWGAAIYVQHAHYTVVSGNSTDRTNLNTDTERTGSSAITVANCTNVTVTGNSVIDAAWYGIMLIEVNNLGTEDYGSTVSGNLIENATKDAIYLKGWDIATVTGNTVNGGAAMGIRVDQGASALTAEQILISSNAITKTGGHGISVDDTAYCSVTNNEVFDCTGSGIIVYTGVTKVNENTVRDCTSRGIYIDTGVDGMVMNNQCYGNTYNFLLNAAVRWEGNMYGSAGTADFQGTFGSVYLTFTDADTTPSVKNRTLYKATNTSATTITDFDDGYDGQVIQVTAENSNTTISHGSNILLTGNANFAMTSGETLTVRLDGTTWHEVGRLDR